MPSSRRAAGRRRSLWRRLRWTAWLFGEYFECASGRSVSRILSSESHRFTPRRRHPCSLAWAIISLGSLPETQVERAAPSSLFDLAPDGGCLAAHIAVDAGGLLHHLFIMTGSGAHGRLSGCSFLWPVPTDRSIPGFPRRRALWSTDFPRPSVKESRDRPTGLRQMHHTRLIGERQLRPRDAPFFAGAPQRNVQPAIRPEIGVNCDPNLTHRGYSAKTAGLLM